MTSDRCDPIKRSLLYFLNNICSNRILNYSVATTVSLRIIGKRVHFEFFVRFIRVNCIISQPSKASKSAFGEKRCCNLVLNLFILFSGELPEDLLTETILTVAEVVWAQSGSQQLLAQNIPSSGTEHKSAVNTLLICMLNEKQVPIPTPYMEISYPSPYMEILYPSPYMEILILVYIWRYYIPSPYMEISYPSPYMDISYPSPYMEILYPSPFMEILYPSPYMEILYPSPYMEILYPSPYMEILSVVFWCFYFKIHVLHTVELG